MSTNSTIAIRHLNGSVSSIYCHSDGFLNHNGVILAKSYASLEKVRDLISLGNLSFLEEEIAPPPGKVQHFNPGRSLPGVCIFYRRDRGDDEDSCRPSHHPTWESFCQRHTRYSNEYVYQEKDQEWFVFQEKKALPGAVKTRGDRSLIPLLRVLKKYQEELSPLNQAWVEQAWRTRLSKKEKKVLHRISSSIPVSPRPKPRF